MKRILLLFPALLCLAAVFSCRKAGEDQNQFGLTGAELTSSNLDFERDWASATSIRLVTDYYMENDKPVVKSIEVPLPWVYWFLPEGDHIKFW